MNTPEKVNAGFNPDTVAPAATYAGHISTNLAYYEAARTGFFTLIVDDIDNIIKASDSAQNPADRATIEHAQEYLTLNVVKAPVPHFSLTQLEYTRGNEKVKFAGVPTWESGTIVVDDVVGLDTKSILMAWQGLAYDVWTRKGGRMKDYKKDAVLIEYTQDYEEIRSWKLYGCWISDLSEDDFDKENDGKRQVTATIQYDRAEMRLPETEPATPAE